MGRSVTVFDGHPLLGENRTALPTEATPGTVGTEPLPLPVLTGKRIFYNAADTRMSADGYLSCASCHVDGGTCQPVFSQASPRVTRQHVRSWSSLNLGSRRSPRLMGRQRAPGNWRRNGRDLARTTPPARAMVTG